MIDSTDLMIIKLLKENSRLKWKEIGEVVHMTGQAVANRIQKLEELGIIENYTINLNKAKMGIAITAFITVFMKTNNHSVFTSFVKENNSITEAYRISGEGCYVLKAHLASQGELNELLDKILKFGNYKINLSIGKIK